MYIQQSKIQNDDSRQSAQNIRVQRNKRSIAFSVLQRSVRQIRNNTRRLQPVNLIQVNLSNLAILQGKVKCPICQQDFFESQLKQITNCNHKYCIDCVNLHLVYRLQLFKQIKCPDESCEAIFSKQSPAYILLSIEQKSQYEKYQKFLEQLQNSKYKICPKKNCIGKFNIQKQNLSCQNCNVLICGKCYLQFHDGDCVQMQISMIFRSMKKCPSCQNFFQKIDGCNHMTCICCGFQFCYACGQPWVGHICSAIPPLKNNLLYRFLAIFWVLFGGIILGLILISIFIGFGLISIIIGPFVYFYQKIKKPEDTKLIEWILIITLILGIVYGQYYFFKRYLVEVKTLTQKFINFFMTHLNLILQK